MVCPGLWVLNTRSTTGSCNNNTCDFACRSFYSARPGQPPSPTTLFGQDTQLDGGEGGRFRSAKVILRRSPAWLPESHELLQNWSDERDKGASGILITTATNSMMTQPPTEPIGFGLFWGDSRPRRLGPCAQLRQDCPKRCNLHVPLRGILTFPCLLGPLSSG